MNDLHDMLRETPDLEVEHAEDRQIAPQSDHTLQLDEWSIRRGEELYRFSEPLQTALEPISDANPLMHQLESATADFHAAAFEPEVEFTENPKHQRVKKYMENLLQSKEFQELHQETMYDDVASEIATAYFMRGFAQVISQPENPDDFQEKLRQVQAIHQSVTQCHTEVQEMRDMQSSLGIGGSGGGDGRISMEELRNRFYRMRNSRMLAMICQQAGRYRRFAQSCQRRKSQHGRDDMVGVELSGDLGRLLPAEAMLFADPLLEWDVARRLLENAALTREMAGIETVAKGPIVVVVDESGSMSGDPIVQAKSLALAMYWVANHQNRYVCLVGFSGGTNGTYCVIPPGHANPDDLMNWLEHFFGGGTTCDVPLVELPAKWESLGVPEGKTDMLVITDACVYCGSDVAERFNTWKREHKVRMNLIVIGDQPGELAMVADKWWSVSDLDIGQEAIAESLSI